jgi:hypothetical protein
MEFVSAIEPGCYHNLSGVCPGSRSHQAYMLATRRKEMGQTTARQLSREILSNFSRSIAPQGSGRSMPSMRRGIKMRSETRVPRMPAPIRAQGEPRPPARASRSRAIGDPIELHKRTKKCLLETFKEQASKSCVERERWSITGGNDLRQERNLSSQGSKMLGLPSDLLKDISALRGCNIRHTRPSWSGVATALYFLSPTNHGLGSHLRFSWSSKDVLRFNHERNHTVRPN